MAAIDTNVLVRLVMKDDLAQYQKGLAFIEAHQPVWVAHLSILELAWVLLSRYRLTKAKVCEVVRALLEMAALNIQQPAILEAAVKTWETSSIDFADAFILESARAASETPLGTFGSTLGKIPGTKFLSTKS